MKYKISSQSFRSSVYEMVSCIPQGKVATYGQIASLIGKPGTARQVGYALRILGVNEHEVPWWRVINSKGYLSINQGKGFSEKLEQKEKLEAEGVLVSDDFEIDLGKYLWDENEN